MPAIRNLAVGLPVCNGYVLVSDATDSIKGEAFYRAIGGGIAFGETAETAETAVRRELAEELGISLAAVYLLGVVENIFEYEGQPGHQIVHVFAVHSKELDTIPLDAQLYVLDEGSPVGWKRTNRMDRPLYPAGAMDLLRSQPDTLHSRWSEGNAAVRAGNPSTGKVW